MGKDSINAIMKKMKQNSPLREICPDKKLTNHSRRKTVVIKMKASATPKCEITNVIGHRHERGLDQYTILETRMNKDFDRMLLTKCLPYL